MSGKRRATDLEFIADLRAAVDRYLRALDQWEAAYQKYYRLPGYAGRISSDLKTEHREYDERRRELREMLPRARRLCLKHGLRDPFTGFERVSLGRNAPQHRTGSAIGRNERSAMTTCLLGLREACLEGQAGPRPAKRSLLRRLASYFD